MTDVFVNVTRAVELLQGVVVVLLCGVVPSPVLSSACRPRCRLPGSHALLCAACQPKTPAPGWYVPHRDKSTPARQFQTQQPGETHPEFEIWAAFNLQNCSRKILSQIVFFSAIKIEYSNYWWLNYQCLSTVTAIYSSSKPLLVCK